MKIYFAGSIRGGRDDKDLYMEIIKLLQKHGEVLTEHIGAKNLTGMGEVTKTVTFIYKRDVKWLKSADVVVAEVTQPSLGVGYELGLSESLKKKTICIYREIEGKKVSAMILGNKKLIIKKYKILKDLKFYFSKVF